MEEPYLLHIITPVDNPSPFDVYMGYKAGYNGVISYTNVGMEEVSSLVQDIVFSLGHKGVPRSAVFIAGRDPGFAIDMMYRARSAVMQPFELSIFADPGGAFTLAAAVTASVEYLIKLRTGRKLAGQHVAVFDGTEPLGICCGILAARLGAFVTLLSDRGKIVADQVVEEYNQRYDLKMMGGDSSTRVNIHDVLAQSEVVIVACRDGMQMLNEDDLRRAPLLMAAVDVNPVPPFGIARLRSGDFGVRMEATSSNALGAGAMAVGKIKFQVHQHIFDIIKTSKESMHVGMEYAMEVARQHVPKEPTCEEEHEDL